MNPHEVGDFVTELMIAYIIKRQQRNTDAANISFRWAKNARHRRAIEALLCGAACLAVSLVTFFTLTVVYTFRGTFALLGFAATLTIVEAIGYDAFGVGTCAVRYACCAVVAVVGLYVATITDCGRCKACALLGVRVAVPTRAI